MLRNAYMHRLTLYARHMENAIAVHKSIGMNMLAPRMDAYLATQGSERWGLE